MILPQFSVARCAGNGERHADLGSGAFLGRRSANGDRDDRGDEHYRHDGRFHLFRMPVYCLDDVLRAVALGIGREDLHDKGAREMGRGKQKKIVAMPRRNGDA
ncbi:MAG TPA: hypothetical protein VEI57_18715 [Nitrospirota bacterium]|nr:hypothetical protein [Nitrospirota bacterium]